MSTWQAFDDLMQIEKAQNLLKSWNADLEIQRIILANRERSLLSGMWQRDGLASVEKAREEVRLLQQRIEITLQRIEQTQEALAQGPQACRALEEQCWALDRKFDVWGRGGAGKVPTRGVVRPAGARRVAADAATGDFLPPRIADAPTGAGVAPEAPPGGPAVAPEVPPGAPVAAGEEVLAGGEAATGAGAEAVAASRLGRVLVGAAVILALAGGAYWAYNHFTSPSPSSSSSSSAPFDISGDYNGTANGAACAKPECYVTVTKVSDPSGPGEDNAGKITVNFTAVNWTPASTGVASVINMKIGPMDAWLQQDGTVKETGYNPWTIITDTTPGSNSRTSGSYKLSGKFTSGTNGSPSYTLTMNVSGLDYQLVGTRAG
ncbi:hypothetical protein AB0G83_35235 [Streptomyces klenkii]|uniref:hypothetical protein n=1 Tax=Streptomyces klenkii TaxID=1420899 RepID=UPI003402CF52